MNTLKNTCESLGLSITSTGAVGVDDEDWKHVLWQVLIKTRTGKIVYAGPYHGSVGLFAGCKGDPMIAAEFANRIGIRPAVEDVMRAVLNDSKAWFERMDFDSWCSGLARDSDSIHNRTLYDESVRFGKQLCSALSRDEVSVLREAMDSDTNAETR